MFKIDKEEDLSFLSGQLEVAEKNYTIQPNDLLEVKVFTNNGERIIDPNHELQITQNNQDQQYREKPEFLVLDSGEVKLPMIGYVHVAGLTLDDAEKLLEEKYSNYYKGSFVRLKYLNKRVIVLGAMGGKVVPLENESTTVLEVLAMAGGIDENGKSRNIRLIRGDLHHPEVFIIDLSTIQGMTHSMLDVRPGDIIYVEPVARIFNESVKGLATVLAIASNIIVLIVALNRL